MTVRPNPHLFDLLGNTPVARIDTPLPHRHGGFWAKLECPGAGGMKARSAVAMLPADDPWTGIGGEDGTSCLAGAPGLGVAPATESGGVVRR